MPCPRCNSETPRNWTGLCSVCINTAGDPTGRGYLAASMHKIRKSLPNAYNLTISNAGYRLYRPAEQGGDAVGGDPYRMELEILENIPPRPPVDIRSQERMRCIEALEKKACYGTPTERAAVQRAITTILEMD